MSALSLAHDPERAADLSFDALKAAVDRQVQVLREQGLGSGQVVACRAEPGLYFCLMQHALARAGAVLLPFAPGLTGGDLRQLIASVSAEWTWAAECGKLIPSGLPSPLHPAPRLGIMIRTSGSTGAPRVAMLTTDNVLASCLRVTRRLALGPGDEWLCCLPLHGVGGLAIGYRCALAGAVLRLHKGFDAAAVAADLASRTITHISLVPPMLAELLGQGVRPPRCLRVALVGGQALNPGLARRAMAKGWPLHVSYGMSETSSMVATRKLPSDGGCMALGPPLLDVKLDAGTCGEEPRCLKIKGPMVMAGYGNPRRVPGLGLTDDVWLPTSDIACLDGAAGLRIFGRADEALVIGGVQILPARVEAQLATVSGIEDLVVLGVPHPTWGATLAVCYSGGMDPDQLADWCRENICGRERPRIVIRYGRLPRLLSGKSDRPRLLREARAAAIEVGTGQSQGARSEVEEIFNSCASR